MEESDRFSGELLEFLQQVKNRGVKEAVVALLTNRGVAGIGCRENWLADFSAA
jgi:hypothetical protein